MLNLNRGFTLLEVIVALVVLTITLATIIKTTTENTKNVAYLRDRTLAHWVAMNVLTETRVHKRWPSVGEEQTGEMRMANQTWLWVIHVSSTADEELRRLTVKVYSTETQILLTVLVGFVELT